MRLRSAIADLRRQTRNLEIPRCAIAHLRFATARRPGMTAWNSCLHYLKNQLIRLRQVQHLFGDKAENELRADRGDPRDQGFAQVALDMKFLGVAAAAVSHHRLLAGLKAGFSGEV